MAPNLKLPYLATAARSGALFGAGLYVSQMVDPFKVLRFLDFGAISSGGWDPSLAFVMGAALLVMVIAVQRGASERRGRVREVAGGRGMHRASITRLLSLLQVDHGKGTIVKCLRQLRHDAVTKPVPSQLCADSRCWHAAASDRLPA